MFAKEGVILKVLLTTLNSKYIHSSLALRYLRAYCGDMPWDLKVREFTINDSEHSVLGEIYKEKPDIIAFSCYIWNITETLLLARRIKQVMGDTIIILGGPEVSYDDFLLIKRYPFIDYIVRGEGEVTFKELLEHVLEHRGNIEKIPGITYRTSKGVIQNRSRDLIKELSSIPFPYTFDKDLKNKIVYYEASRGCPFHCTYCLSSTVKGVRFLPLQRVKKDLAYLIELGVKQVKFVDRTFNCDINFSREIFSFLMEGGGDTNFHFEIYADLLNDELINLLAEAPPGLFQFEIGVQTTNPEVLREVRRSPRQDKLFDNVKGISKGQNIHQHLDLIAGLPKEDMKSFEKSFNDVYALKPDMLQLGFLKLLKGSEIRKNAKEYGYEFIQEPPYEVLSNKWMDYNDMRRLKLIERVFNYFYNSHGFDNTLRFIIDHLGLGAFAFFKGLSEYWEEEGLHLKRQSRRDLYSLLYKYCKGKNNLPILYVNELLKLDFLQKERTPALPNIIKRFEPPSFKQRCLDFLKSPGNVKNYIPEYAGLSQKRIYKLIHFETFDPCIIKFVPGLKHRDSKEKVTLLFDYCKRDKLRGKARITAIEL